MVGFAAHEEALGGRDFHFAVSILVTETDQGSHDRLMRCSEELIEKVKVKRLGLEDGRKEKKK